MKNESLILFVAATFWGKVLKPKTVRHSLHPLVVKRLIYFWSPELSHVSILPVIEEGRCLISPAKIFFHLPTFAKEISPAQKH